MSTANKPQRTTSPASSVTTSLWNGLNPHLLADMWKLVKRDNQWTRDTSTPTFRAAMMEASMEIALNWQSPFENSGTDTQAPTLSAMLQSGSLQPLLAALTNNGEQFSQIHQKAGSVLSSFEGRTGITKLNSTQVFNGMPPVKITGTLMLRAWADALAEVQRPLDLLMDWALPQELSKDGSVLARAAQGARGQMGTIEALMPSLAPVPVAMRYKRYLFQNMVLESAQINLDSPITVDGYFAEMRIPITLCSMTAIDRHDWKKIADL